MGPALLIVLVGLLSSTLVRAHEAGTTTVSVLFPEGRTYDIEIVTDAPALVVAMNRLNPSEKLTARTDSDGRVRFRLRPGGMWLVKAVHMIPAPAGANAEWASFWASLTFEMRTATSEAN